MKELGKYYTRADVAAELIKSLAGMVQLGEFVFVEPSAGCGAFVEPLRERDLEVAAVDLDPQAPGILQGDFLRDSVWPADGRIAVIGNPPFGFASSLAVRFFNRAAERADLIAFIVPRTFRKISVHDKLNRRFWLMHDEDVPRNSFILGSKPHDVPCAWQVWERRASMRRQTPFPDVSSIIRYTGQDTADFAFRRVGGRAGTVLPLGNGNRYSARTTYFMHSMRPDAAQLLASIDWTNLRSSTAGVRSISKREIALELAKIASCGNSLWQTGN